MCTARGLQAVWGTLMTIGQWGDGKCLPTQTPTAFFIKSGCLELGLKSITGKKQSLWRNFHSLNCIQPPKFREGCCKLAKLRFVFSPMNRSTKPLWRNLNGVGTVEGPDPCEGATEGPRLHPPLQRKSLSILSLRGLSLQEKPQR